MKFVPVKRKPQSHFVTHANGHRHQCLVPPHPKKKVGSFVWNNKTVSDSYRLLVCNPCRGALIHIVQVELKDG